MEGVPQYDDSNRAFLQAFLARGVLTFTEAKLILAAIFSTQENRDVQPEDVTEADFNSLVHAANDAISPFDFSIRSTLSQYDRSTRVFALINTTSDPTTQLATTHTADEIAYVKRLLDAMFDTYNTPRQEVMALTSMQAVRLHKSPANVATTVTNDGQPLQQGTGASGNLTMGGAEKVLADLVAGGWLEKSRAGFYSLSPRALLELGQYLFTTYNDEEEEGLPKIKQCHACKEIVTVGQRCPTESCPVRLHNICTQSFFTALQSRRCPTCNDEWTGENYVGEKAVTTTDSWQRGRRRSGGGSLGRQSNGVADADSD